MGEVDAFFVDYIDEKNLNNDLKKFYEFINEDNELIDLKLLIKENEKRYYEIKIDDLDELSEDFDEVKKEIKKIHGFISPESLKFFDLEIAKENKKILDLLYKYLNQLEIVIQNEINELEKENNLRQEKIKHINYSEMDKKTLLKILDKYNSLISYNYNKENSIYKNYKKQLKRKKTLNKIYRLINLELEDRYNNIKALEELQSKTFEEIKKFSDRILYLEDLMIENSKYVKEFLIIKKYFSELIAYDDTDYLEVSKVYNFLTNNTNLKDKLKEFEEVFINERENYLKEENFIYEKLGIKNLKISLDYISANYMEHLSERLKKIVNEIYEEIEKENVNVTGLYKNLKEVVDHIWKYDITDVYSYKQGNDFCFICTNNQFIDEKYQAILVTQKMLERVNDYSNYQIGFVCNFDDNILYVSETEDIMEAEHNDMSNLKTPKQIEQEFLNFKIRNRLALNGYKTNITAVYLIDDGEFIKYKKALELANQYSLPLIILKKDKC